MTKSDNGEYASVTKAGGIFNSEVRAAARQKYEEDVRALATQPVR